MRSPKLLMQIFPQIFDGTLGVPIFQDGGWRDSEGLIAVGGDYVHIQHQEVGLRGFKRVLHGLAGA